MIQDMRPYGLLCLILLFAFSLLLFHNLAQRKMVEQDDIRDGRRAPDRPAWTGEEMQGALGLGAGSGFALAAFIPMFISIAIRSQAPDIADLLLVAGAAGVGAAAPFGFLFYHLARRLNRRAPSPQAADDNIIPLHPPR